jgi:hypothetical protein
VTIQELANKICKELPEGWEIKLEMENGSGCWYLLAPRSRLIEFEDVCSVDDPFEQQPLKMLEYALATAA